METRTASFNHYMEWEDTQSFRIRNSWEAGAQLKDSHQTTAGAEEMVDCQLLLASKAVFWSQS